MQNSYFKSAYRNVISNKLYTLINVLGLAIGIVCAVFIYLFVNDELTFDTNWKNYDRIYRLESLIELNGKKDKAALSSFPLAPVMAEEIKEIESFSRFSNFGYTLVKSAKKQSYESNFYIADSTALNIFNVDIKARCEGKLLAKPNSAIINESTATKYFGKGNAIGKVLSFDNDIKVTVTGVFKDNPKNIHLKFDALISMSTLSTKINDTIINSREPRRFWSLNTFSYVLIKPNSTIKVIEDGFNNVFNKYMAKSAKMINARFKLQTTKLNEIHLYSNVAWDLPTGKMSTIIIFIAIGIFIILIACINYMNLATARAANRAKEVGIRKVLGSNKGNLFYQFMSESILMTFFSLIIALAFIELLLPIFNELADKSISLNSLKQFSNIFWVALITLATGIIAGSYPAIYLSSFQPAQILKSKFSNSRKNGRIRKFLVVFQFIISIILISGTFIIWEQMSYIQTKDLGYDKDDLVVLRLRDTTLLKKAALFKTELKKNKLIKAMSSSHTRMGNSANMLVARVEQNGKMQEQTINIIVSDFDFIKTMGLNVIKGRDFDTIKMADNRQSLIVNEAAMRKFGWTGNPIGKIIRFGASLDSLKDSAYKIIGVVKDFNYRSLHNAVEPVVIAVGNEFNSYINIRIEGAKRIEAIEYIKTNWNRFFSQYPFDYQFLDYHLTQNYNADKKMGRLFSYFSVVCIFIAVMGLFGLSSYVAESRRKEIAVRKVVGASMFEIFRIIYREFFSLISVAIIIAVPITYYLSNIWLKNFAYQIQVGWTPFFYSALLSYSITILTVFYQTYRSANENPADILKYE